MINGILLRHCEERVARRGNPESRLSNSLFSGPLTTWVATAFGLAMTGGRELRVVNG
jgi:hypothetical protein